MEPGRGGGGSSLIPGGEIVWSMSHCSFITSPKSLALQRDCFISFSTLDFHSLQWPLAFQCLCCVQCRPLCFFFHCRTAVSSWSMGILEAAQKAAGVTGASVQYLLQSVIIVIRLTKDLGLILGLLGPSGCRCSLRITSWSLFGTPCSNLCLDSCNAASFSGLQVAGISQRSLASLPGCGGDQGSCGVVLKRTGCSTRAVIHEKPLISCSAVATIAMNSNVGVWL